MAAVLPTEAKKTGFIFKTDTAMQDADILAKIKGEGIPLVHFDATEWSDASKMEAAFKASFPNQETPFLAGKFKQDGQIIVVSGISPSNMDSITFLVITLSHIFTQMEESETNPRQKPCAIVLKGWPIDFIGMALESGAELRFAVEPLP
ncbi:uncharacterized protein MONOS_8701 [Monocercomonoides exilis]|uniref:uncharacterized protein n=1 Tax=Monocercomonoides exilis TaxID=2049356 RepID=UPI0035595F37|nr:hypothetical protein MONOS_8701 [Monocercomonoides exilis]|eukprot:MONOS_8701.1-p1 / transcript=MONOS_8701.1 / gene=MONOS_8701 / organism=Monocercomonoides_exilis_PA203 / gene_product=unspecified product / transcript_product=unspecified product / location=Mono_scaffold00335:17868-18429(-) / protein_length=149 / sequence_SO=supercontig / SO=protein_coding / is_pseudo=false